MRSTALPEFAGVDKLVKLVGSLFRRPRFGDRPRELNDASGEWSALADQRQRSGRQGLPMVCLVRPSGHEDVLGSIRGLLEEAKPDGVRHAFVAFADDRAGSSLKVEPLETADVLVIRDRLREARNKLINSPRVKDGRPRFRLFTLAAWLTDQTLDVDDPDRERTLLGMIQSVGINQRFRSVLQVADAELASLNPPWRVPLWLARLATAVTFRIAVTGRVPVISGQYRWFMRQRYLAPELSGSFVRFAGRLTASQVENESAEDMARLLVNAFLEDLRRAYRLRPWSPRRRRMTYPVLLLDNITMTNGGYQLLRVINDVRNQVGIFDPLLVISASRAVPPDAGRVPGRPEFSAAESLTAYRAWQNQLLRDRRSRVDNAWYLPISIPETGTNQRAHLDFDGYEAPRRAARSPWWATRLIRIGVPVLVAAALAAGFIARDRDYRDSHCGTADAQLSSLTGECVGVTDGSYHIYQPSDATIDQVEHKILTQNTDAAAAHQASPGRPYITLVYVAATTASTADALTTERESLEGVAVAQSEQNADVDQDSLLVRILIANAGRDMVDGPWLAAELGRMAARDPGIAGIVGLDQSRLPTQNTIAALAREGMPMVASTLSADGMINISPMYFQVAPQDSREAAVVAAFARHLLSSGQLKSHTVYVYYSSDRTDVYSSNLSGDAASALTADGFQVQTVPYAPGDAYSAGQETCGIGGGTAFFAGRGTDFGDFLAGAGQCYGSTLPTIIGDDDATTFVADTPARILRDKLPYYYASFAVSPNAAPPGAAAASFYSLLDGMFPFERQASTGRSYDGHAALSYDATEVMITAAQYLTDKRHPIPVTPGTLWREITAMHGQDFHLKGASGTIDFGDDVASQVPFDKPVAILQVDDGLVNNDLAGFCGLSDAQQPSSWCPKAS